MVVYAQLRNWCDNPGDPSCCLGDGGVPTLKCLEVVYGNLLFMSSAFVILILFIMFVIGSFNYLTSFGNPEKIKKAQGTFKYAIIGLILFVSSYVILKTVDCLFLGCQDKLFKLNIDAPVNEPP